MSTAIPRISKLSGNVWRILGCNPGPMTLQGTNVYLIGNGPRRILIDAGQDGFPEYISNLSNVLAEQKVSIDKIIITHWHKDHIGALSELSSEIFEGKYQSRPTVYKFQRTEVPEDPLPAGYSLETLVDNQVLETEGATLRLLFTPGHTTDHASVYFTEEQAVFSGDCILGEGTCVFQDLHDYMNSLKRILSENPQIIYPAHGPVISNPAQWIQYYLNHRNEREKQIVAILSAAEAPMKPSEIVKIAYKDTPEHLHPAAENNVRHHLEKLIKEKRILRRGEDKYVFHHDSPASKSSL